MQTDYGALAKAATAFAAVSQIWDVMVRFRPEAQPKVGIPLPDVG